MGLTTEVINWFQRERGISAATLEAFGISVADDGGVVFPYPGFEKKRFGIPVGDRRFSTPRGITPQLFGSAERRGSGRVFLVEGETDCMRLWQELGGEYDVLALPGIETWSDSIAERLGGYDLVYVILDNDADYNVRGRVDTCWKTIRQTLGIKKARRIVLPSDVKDVCEFFGKYNLEALRALAARRTPAGESKYRSLDLLADPPPVRWLVDGLICRGDIHLLIGEPGIGKSWLTMGLALAVAEGRESFLGKALHDPGRVLYIDEENPEDLVYDRFHKLGLTKAGARNIRYLNNVGLKLDRGDADDLVEEALDYDPTLVVLDSLTRFHVGEENSAGVMAKLFQDAIKPLARETGAAVVLIHHANKTESNSSYKRSRGSGDITASVDSGFDVREVGDSSLALANFKSRRQAQGDTMYIRIVDTDTGVDLVSGAQVVPF